MRDFVKRLIWSLICVVLFAMLLVLMLLLCVAIVSVHWVFAIAAAVFGIVISVSVLYMLWSFINWLFIDPFRKVEK